MKLIGVILRLYLLIYIFVLSCSTDRNEDRNRIILTLGNKPYTKLMIENEIKAKKVEKIATVYEYINDILLTNYLIGKFTTEDSLLSAKLDSLNELIVTKVKLKIFLEKNVTNKAKAMPFLEKLYEIDNYLYDVDYYKLNEKDYWFSKSSIKINKTQQVDTTQLRKNFPNFTKKTHKEINFSKTKFQAIKEALYLHKRKHIFFFNGKRRTLILVRNKKRNKDGKNFSIFSKTQLTEKKLAMNRNFLRQYESNKFYSSAKLSIDSGNIAKVIKSEKNDEFLILAMVNSDTIFYRDIAYTLSRGYIKGKYNTVDRFINRYMVTRFFEKLIKRDNEYIQLSSTEIYKANYKKLRERYLLELFHYTHIDKYIKENEFDLQEELESFFDLLPSNEKKEREKYIISYLVPYKERRKIVLRKFMRNIIRDILKQRYHNSYSVSKEYQ